MISSGASGTPGADQTKWAECCDTTGGGDGDVVYGCTDPLALGYDPLATIDDGSCYYGEGDLPMGVHNFGVSTPNKLSSIGEALPIGNNYSGAGICAFPPSPGAAVYGGHMTKNFVNTVLNPNNPFFELNGTGNNVGGGIYTESHYWNIGGLTVGDTYKIHWKEIVLALRTAGQCSDCLKGGWAVRIGDWNPFQGFNEPTYAILGAATTLYDPVANGTLSEAGPLYHDSNCEQDTLQISTNTAGASNGSESEWNDRCTTFTATGTEHRIHFIAFTDFNDCTGCHSNPSSAIVNPSNIHGAYVGLSKVGLISGLC